MFDTSKSFDSTLSSVYAIFSTAKSFYSTLSYPVCMAPPNHSAIHFPIYMVLPNHSTMHFLILHVCQRLVPPNLSQYTFLSYLSYIHNILSCVTFMVAPLIIQQTIFHGASVFHASVFMPYNNFAHHVEVIVLSASVSVSNDLPFYGCDCVQRCHAV